MVLTSESLFTRDRTLNQRRARAGNKTSLPTAGGKNSLALARIMAQTSDLSVLNRGLVSRGCSERKLEGESYCALSFGEWGYAAASARNSTN